jgi:uncharacterized damage-inducible protein DinB
MKRTLVVTVVALTLAFAIPTLVLAQAAPAPAKTETAKPAAGVRGEILGQIEDAEKKLLALAEALPTEKFGWRPAEGVRSAGEVFAHVAGGNYFLPTFWGVKPPAGVDPRSFEKEGGDKAKTVDNLKKSFEHARQAILSVPDADLDKAVKLFGNDSTTRGAFMLVATHAHEHLGQSIAYARMNGVTPPWSAAQ